MKSHIRKLPSSVTPPAILPSSSTTFDEPKAPIPPQEHKTSRSKGSAGRSLLGHTSFHCILPRTSRADTEKMILGVRQNMKTQLVGISYLASATTRSNRIRAMPVIMIVTEMEAFGQYGQTTCSEIDCTASGT